MALVTGVLVTIPDSDEDSRHYLSEFLDALVEALSEEAAERSAQELATNRHSAGLAAREKAAKRSVADADRKIARLEQALEDGLPLATFVRLARKHEIARDAAKAELTRISKHQPEGLSPEEFKVGLEHARGLAAALAGATDTQRQQLYEALGLEIEYDPSEKVVHASISPLAPVGVKPSVGGGTSTLTPRLEVTGQRSIPAA